jgi:hypothetical protein
VKIFIVNFDIKLYSSSEFIRILKSERMKRAGQVAGTEENRNAYKMYVRRNLWEREGLLKPGFQGRIILKSILEEI